MMIVIPTLGTGGREKIAIDNAVNFDKKKQMSWLALYLKRYKLRIYLIRSPKKLFRTTPAWPI